MNDLPNIFSNQNTPPAEPFTPATPPVVEGKAARKPRGARRGTVATPAEQPAAGAPTKPAKKPRKSKKAKAVKAEPFVMSASNLLALGASLPPEAAALVGKYVDDFNGMALDIRDTVLDTLRKIYG